jgi:hypothetical protein
MDNRIRLRVIERPAMGPDGSFTDRSLIIPLNQDPLVFEGERIAPDLCCGHCGAILTTGVSLRQFGVTGDPGGLPSCSVTHLPVGGTSVTRTIAMPFNRVLAAANGPLVLACVKCRHYNEVPVAP